MQIDPILETLLVPETLRHLSSDGKTLRAQAQHNWCSDHWRIYFEMMDYCVGTAVKTIKRPFTSQETLYVSERIKRFLTQNAL